MIKHSLCAGLLAFAAAASAAPSIPLVPGEAQVFSIPANAITNSYYIDIAEGANQLSIDLTADHDVDLLLKYGIHFPDSINGLASTANKLFEIAHYRSVSEHGNERLAIGKYNWQPLRAGRWFVSVVNSSTTPAETRLTANVSNSSAVANLPIEVVFDDPGTTEDPCNIAGWNDSASRSPVAGNNASTLGQLRRNALLEAVRRIGEEIKSPTPIRLQACWDDLGTGNSVTLARAGPWAIFKNDIDVAFNRGTGQNYVSGPSRNPWLPRAYTWYTSAAATKLAGTRACGIEGGSCNNMYDIVATFNNQVDTEAALGSQSFYYGFTPATTGNDTDFITVAMHEILHGLGFLSLINMREGSNPIGGKLLGYDDIFSANTSRVQGDGAAQPYVVTPFLTGTNADRASALTSITGLRWSGAEAANSTLNPFASFPTPDNYVRLYAPDPISPGSTFSHLAAASTQNSLMLPSASTNVRTLGIAAPMLNAVGWSSQPSAQPANALPRPTHYYDPAHTGHGINFGRLYDNVYYLAFYTYDANGAPEFYLSVGQVMDGVYFAWDDAYGNSLYRVRYDANASPRQTIDPASNGQVRLDFNQAELSPACNDGVQRARSDPWAVMSWSIGTDRNYQWCMQAIIPETIVPTPNFTGAWYAGPSDSGWGLDMASFVIGGNVGLGSTLYYYDATGVGRWAYVQTAQFVPGQQYNLYERHGYCRTCAPPQRFEDVLAGTIVLDLRSPSMDPAAGNRITYRVDYQRPPGGRFERTSVPLILLTTPR